MPFTAFVDFCTELGTQPARGAPTACAESLGTSSTHQHCFRAMSTTLAKQFEGFADCCLELARSAKTAARRARLMQMAREYRLATLRIELSSHLRPGNADHNGGTNWPGELG